VRTTSRGFVRFHFGARGRRGNYSNAELAESPARLAEWREEELWIYFNNDWSAFAIKNALRLRRLLEERAAGA